MPQARSLGQKPGEPDSLSLRLSAPQAAALPKFTRLRAQSPFETESRSETSGPRRKFPLQ